MARRCRVCFGGRVNSRPRRNQARIVDAARYFYRHDCRFDCPAVVGQRDGFARRGGDGFVRRVRAEGRA